MRRNVRFYRSAAKAQSAGLRACRRCRPDVRDDLVAAGHDPQLVDRVLRMVDVAEYKRRQSAPGTKISFKAFGRDRRLPITNRFREGV